MRGQGTVGGNSERGNRGFSLVELLVAVAIVAVLAGVGIPSLSSFLRKVKLNSISGALVSSLQQARSDAIRLNRAVLVCPSNSDGTDCATSTNWAANGWRVCYAQLASDACQASTTALPNPLRVEGKVDTTFAGVAGPSAPIRFSPAGSQGATGASTVTITVTGTWTGATALTVTVTPSGSIKGSRA
jgi:type IV fimbrial biogenesis protein FimT